MTEPLRYRALVLDHDDTVVESTRFVHYPAFLLGMEELRPELRVSLEEFFLLNFRPGIHAWYRDIAGLNEEEYQREYEIWQDYVSSHVPLPYPGISELLWRHRNAGGLIFVSSHSVKEQILRDYRANGLPEPDGVYGWELPVEKRKPDPFALHDLMARHGLQPEELVLVDDLRFGCEMAKLCGVTAVGALWPHSIGEIHDHMRGCCDHCCQSVAELESFLFSQNNASV